jgi:alcohol dehydrogenase YqhD (iron-dependent ADH family)
MDFQHPERTAKAGIQAFRNFLKSIGMPQTMTELGGKEEDIPYLSHTAAYGNEGDGSLGRFVELKEEDIANIYRLML